MKSIILHSEYFNFWFIKNILMLINWSKTLNAGLLLLTLLLLDLSKRCEYFFHRCLLLIWITLTAPAGSRGAVFWWNNSDEAAEENMKVCGGFHLHHLHYLNKWKTPEACCGGVGLCAVHVLYAWTDPVQRLIESLCGWSVWLEEGNDNRCVLWNLLCCVCVSGRRLWLCDRVRRRGGPLWGLSGERLHLHNCEENVRGEWRTWYVSHKHWCECKMFICISGCLELHF